MVEFFSYWYYHIPNFVFAALMYTSFGVFLLDIFFRPNSKNPIYRAFHRVVDPYFSFIVPITPRFIPPFLVPLYAAFWTLVFRALLYMFCAYFGLLPHIETT